MREWDGMFKVIKLKKNKKQKKTDNKQYSIQPPSCPSELKER